MLNRRAIEKRGMFAVRLAAGMAIGWCVAAAAAQDEGIRFFLDTAGVGEAEARPVATPLAFTNPTLGVGTGTGRFYFYFEFGTANQPMSGVNLRVNIFGDATFTGGAFYNHIVNGLPRWQGLTGATSPTPGTKDWVINSVFHVGGSGEGLRNNPPGQIQFEDTHFRVDDGSPFGTTLLGYFDVAHGTSDNVNAAVHLWSGDSGSAGVTVTPQDIVYFGFGDAGTTNKRDRTSSDPDGYVAPVPEPVTVVALATALLLGRRRRG